MKAPLLIVLGVVVLLTGSGLAIMNNACKSSHHAWCGSMSGTKQTHGAKSLKYGDVGLDGANLFGSAGAQRGHFARNDRCYRHQTSLTTFQKIVTNTWAVAQPCGENNCH